MLFLLDITEITVLTGSGTDQVSIKVKGPSPYPTWLPDQEPTLKLDVAKGYGVRYVIDVFGIDPKVIQM